MLSLEMIREAAVLLQGRFRRTELMHSHYFSDLIGLPVYFKCENLQRSGSFKVRGACYFMSRQPAEKLVAGVVTASAGNHAQGVALSAARLGVPATVVMPENTPLAKVQATRGYGARVILQGTVFDEALEEARRLESSGGLLYVPPFDDPLIMAGQGSVGLEIVEDLPDVGTADIAGTVRCHCRSGRGAVQQTCGQAGCAAFGGTPHDLSQTGDIVQVVPSGQFQEGQPLFRHPLPGDGQHPVGAPGDVGEEFGDVPAQADQDVPAIVRRRHDRIILVQGCKGLADEGGGQIGAVGADDHHLSRPFGKPGGKSLSQPLTEVGAPLLCQWHIWKAVPEVATLPPIKEHAGPRAPGGKVDGLLQAAAIEFGGLQGRQRGAQAGLDPSRLRLFGKNAQNRHACHGSGVVFAPSVRGGNSTMA